MAMLLIFVLLQAGDAATTGMFLARGVTEGNPLLHALFASTGHPGWSLAAAKLAACGLALIAWRSGRMRLLRRANLFFALCVAWNLAAIALAGRG
jgi:hypothetical protein